MFFYITANMFEPIDYKKFIDTSSNTKNSPPEKPIFKNDEKQCSDSIGCFCGKKECRKKNSDFVKYGFKKPSSTGKRRRFK